LNVWVEVGNGNQLRKTKKSRIEISRTKPPTVRTLCKSSNEAKDNSKKPLPKGVMFQTPIGLDSKASLIHVSMWSLHPLASLGKAKSCLQTIISSFYTAHVSLFFYFDRYNVAFDRRNL